MAADLAADFAEQSNIIRPGFADNTTVFGRILRGELPATIIYEDERVLCFKDHAPASDHHLLVIPKERAHLVHCGHFKPSDLGLLQHMVHVGETAATRVCGIEGDPKAARAEGRLALGFHRWPLLTVNHLHLHVITPMPAKSWWYRMLFPQGYGRFFASPEDVASMFCGSKL